MRGTNLRWTASLLLVLAVHGSVLFTLNRLQPTASAEPAEAISIDLTPAPVAPAPVPALPPPPKPAPEVPPVPPAPPEHKPVIHHRTVTQARPKPPAETELPAPMSQAAATPDLTEPPTPTPPPPAADPVTTPSGPAVTNWQGRLAAHLARFKQYPDAARLRGEQGVVLMRLTLTHDGRVVAVSMARSSGHPELDAEGQAWILRAEPYPALPPEITQSQIELTVPLRFTLQ